MLAREWHARVSDCLDGGAPPREIDLLALASLLLAVEYGAQFTLVAERQIETNLSLPVPRRAAAWIDQLPWSSARAAKSEASHRHRAIGYLIANLNHGNSVLRIWTMEVPWICRA